jgi:hypothetical protein
MDCNLYAAVPPSSARSLGVVVALLLSALGVDGWAPAPAAAQDLQTYRNLGWWFRTLEDTVRFAAPGDIVGDRNVAPENSLLRHPAYSTYNTNMRRRMNGGQLQLMLESVGGTHPNPHVAPGYGRLAVASNTPADIFQARVTPMAAEAPSCRATGESLVRAQVVAQLGDNRDPDTRGHGVFATLSLERSSFGGDQVVGVVWVCRRWSCESVSALDSVLFDRSWTLGTAHTLTIQYDRANNSIAFTVAGGATASETRTLSGLPVIEEDYYPNTGFGLRVETIPANCAASGDAPAGRVRVSMDARFDAVRWSAP